MLIPIFLSVHQFTCNNKCFFVFFSDCFYVKDLESGKTLFHGKSDNGLYPLTIHNEISNKTSCPFAFIRVRVPTQIWNSRLAHPASNTLLQLVSNKSLPMKGSNSMSFC